jgi:opacity protein-like surface antigen
MRAFLQNALGAATCLGIAFASPGASADGMPSKATTKEVSYSWTGLYAGVHAGWVRSELNSTAATDSTNFPTGFHFAEQKPDGGLWGVQIGANHQFGRWLAGVEFDWSGTNAHSRATSVSPITNATSPNKQDIDGIATLTARLGYVHYDWLFYAKGGFAWADLSNRSTTLDEFGTLIANNRQGFSADGWVVGAGIEKALGSKVSIKVEYNFVNFSNEDAVTSSTAVPSGVVTPFHRTVDTEMHLVKVGINFKIP